MNRFNNVGYLRYLYLDEIEPNNVTNASEFLINASAILLKQNGGRNWVPIIVKEIGDDKYQVVANSFIYAVVEKAGLDRAWCIVAESDSATAELTQVLAGEQIPKINLSQASRDDIKSALQYLIEEPNSPVKSVDLAVATNRIDEASRTDWKTLDPITTLKCGITKGKKLDALKKVFYLAPSEQTEKPDNEDYSTKTLPQLKKIAKEREVAGYSKMKKSALIEALQKTSHKS